jgi:hypothetical protein
MVTLVTAVVVVGLVLITYVVFVSSLMVNLNISLEHDYKLDLLFIWGFVLCRRFSIGRTTTGNRIGPNLNLFWSIWLWLEGVLEVDCILRDHGN